jgi:hypothetical protein
MCVVVPGSGRSSFARGASRGRPLLVCPERRAGVLLVGANPLGYARRGRVKVGFCLAAASLAIDFSAP